MLRWGITAGIQLLFSTDDEQIARRFMAMGESFQVYDHSIGYYVYMEGQRYLARDLIPENELVKREQPGRAI